MAVMISVGDMVVELLEEGDPIGDKPSVDADDASWELYVRLDKFLTNGASVCIQ